MTEFVKPSSPSPPPYTSLYPPRTLFTPTIGRDTVLRYFLRFLTALGVTAFVGWVFWWPCSLCKPEPSWACWAIAAIPFLITFVSSLRMPVFLGGKILFFFLIILGSLVSKRYTTYSVSIRDYIVSASAQRIDLAYRAAFLSLVWGQFD
ncbi:hypothetical protein ABW19_dt0201304 [Dactylella cylindrospora]|nr:hypothetical protein ABW19_dt0201304 [Dactylella cylindrospora]